MPFLWTLAGIRSPFLTAVFQFFTLFGEELVVVGVFCALYWCLDKALARGVALSFFLSTLLVQVLKIAVRMERPWIADPLFAPVEWALETATGYSFPSGHTQTAASIFGYLALALGKRRKGLAAALWALVALVGLSRLYLGVHTPLDVVCGLALAVLVALFVLWYTGKEKSDLAMCGLLTGLSLLAIAYALWMHGHGIIAEHYLSDCCKAAGGCIGCAVGWLWAKRGIPFATETPRLWQQIVKLLAGIAVLVAIKSGIKALLGGGLLLDTLRYFLIALWALALYPLVFSRVFPGRADRA